MKRFSMALTLVFLALSSIHCTRPQISPDENEVFFYTPRDQAEVTSPVFVKFGLKTMKVLPAGAMDEGTGHHHLIIDGGAIAKGEMIPADEKHIHYGKGQIEDKVKLAPGKHTLTLQFADGAHRSYGPEYSHTISITVK